MDANSLMAQKGKEYKDYTLWYNATHGSTKFMPMVEQRMIKEEINPLWIN